MSFERFPNTVRLLDQAVRDGVSPGFVAGVWLEREPEILHLHAVGDRRLKMSGLSALPMEIDTTFDLASISKLFTATLAAHLVDRKWIRFETRLRSFFPQFRYAEVTIGHLLSHTAGFPAWAPLHEMLRRSFGTDDLSHIDVFDRQKAVKNFALAMDLDRGVGQKAVYSDLSFIVLGFALEEALDLPLDEAVKRYLWSPMKLADEQKPFYRRTSVPAFAVRDDAVAATESCPWRKTVLQGQVHDDNCWSMGGYAGHAGAFGTARHLLRFSQALQGGFLSSPILEKMWTRVDAPENCERTLGWDTPSGERPALGTLFSRDSVGHLGFTGTSLWIDRKNGVTVTLLSNRVHPRRDNEKLKPFRSIFHDGLADELNIDSDALARQNH